MDFHPHQYYVKVRSSYLEITFYRIFYNIIESGIFKNISLGIEEKLHNKCQYSQKILQRPAVQFVQHQIIFWPNKVTSDGTLVIFLIFSCTIKFGRCGRSNNSINLPIIWIIKKYILRIRYAVDRRAFEFIKFKEEKASIRWRPNSVIQFLYYASLTTTIARHLFTNVFW